MRDRLASQPILPIYPQLVLGYGVCRCKGSYFLVLLVSPPQPVTLVVTMVAKPKAKTRATITFFMCKLL